MTSRFVAALLIAVLGIGACSNLDPENLPTLTAPGSTTIPDATTAPDTTTLPDTTTVPEPTPPPIDEDADASTPWWVLIIVGLALLVLLTSFARRGSRRKIQMAPPPHSWKDDARRGYADARWLYDSMSEDLAIWRGNATADSEAAVGGAAGTALASTWNDMDVRLGRASDGLYAAEAAAPDRRTSHAASETVTTMRSVRRAVDSRAEARLNYRLIEADSAGDPTRIHDAREREVRASRNLAEARSAFGAALTNLAAVL